MLRKLCYNFFAFSLLFAASACSITSKQAQLIGRPAPIARYYLLNGEVHSTVQLQNGNLVLIFWDVNCSHCRQALPEINGLAKSFIGDKRLKFVTINLNRQSEEQKVRTKIKELGLDALEHAFSGNDAYDEVFLAFKGENIPYIILIDGKGVVDWIGHDSDELKEKLIALMRRT